MFLLYIPCLALSMNTDFIFCFCPLHFQQDSRVCAVTWIQMFRVCITRLGSQHFSYLIILIYLHKAWIHFHWKLQRGEVVFAFPLRAAAGLRSSVIDCVQLHIAWMPELRETRVGPLWLDTNTGSHILHSVISSAEKTTTLTLWVHLSGWHNRKLTLFAVVVYYY